MEFIGFLIAIIILYIVLKLISLPMKIIIKLMLNALLGGVILFLINIVGAQFGFMLDITWLNALIVGFLGVPGVILVVILHFLL